MLHQPACYPIFSGHASLFWDPSNLRLELIDISNGDQILSNNIKSKGGDFSSREIAGVRAIENLGKKFDNKDLFGNKND